ncbi:MAG: hypothetical protein AAB726_01950 [Patescibacteria group bacterium]
MKETSGITVILGVFLIMALFLSLGLGYGLIKTAFNLNGSGTNGRTLTAGLAAGLLEESILNPEECSSGEYSRWTGSEWICGADRSGGERGPQGIQGPQGPAGGGGGFFGGSTSYFAGEGLRLSGNTFSLDDLESCSSGEYSRWTGSSWGCFDDRGTGNSGGGNSDDVDAGDGLRFDGDSLEIDSPSCSSDQYSRWNGNNWVCATDRTSGTGGSGSFYYAGTGLTLNGDTFSLSGLQSCSSGSFSRWTGSSCVCEADRTGGGTGGGGTGERGPAGPAGERGPAGPTGPQGPSGTGGGGTPSLGSSNWYYGNGDSIQQITCPSGQVVTGLGLVDTNSGCQLANGKTNCGMRVSSIRCAPLQ